MRRAATLLVGAGILVAACGSLLPTASRASARTLTLPGGQVMTLTIEDRTGLVEGLAFVLPDSDYAKDEVGGIAVKNVAEDSSRVLVSWEGGACSPTKATVVIDRADSGVSITVEEPQPCTNQKGRLKTLDLNFNTAMLARSVVATWLPR